mmetsp:Transcript_8169/g.20095  ORF Transcript_8169/g.20095 Transcript_8169/m.20095 type:complete len:343 (-) Transcript_8169:423-1451(-)|eukprot:CAMPEP_0181091768 /NCGR_PEP_ID=MMETSP1071-20121207/8573_1 /TAXON_ID=35127 /ORGANISM="Thalassiosira sp., Strain NH16" /LENGTH=342 /DNA_ID=CAMNT_0023173927 /DNA_START=226 /DNA_END=1254 /DNA_ORIENTATION=+
MQQNNPDPQQREYNTKWKSYCLICATSLTNFISVGEVFTIELPYHYSMGNATVGYMFGAVTFTACLLILTFDLIGFLRNKFDFKSLKDGKVEGWTLFIFVLWWVCGVIVMTRAGSIGYASMNIYFSAWAALFACLDALNRWGGEKDILTLRQLTSISKTLPGWWIVFWASVIVLGSAADATSLSTTVTVTSSCASAVGFSTVTALTAAFFILSHYEFFQCCHACTSWLAYGGLFELVFSVLMNIWLVIELSQLTGPGEIGSTITGNGSGDPTSNEYMPGTNIFIASWAAFIASVMVTVKWKEARAIRFAQTSGGNAGGDEGVNSGEATATENGIGGSDGGGV